MRKFILKDFFLQNYYWTVKLYDIEKLKDNILMKLRANSHKLFQFNFNSLMYFQAVIILYDLEKSQVMTSEKLKCWLQQIIEFDELICVWMITIICNDAFWELLAKFASILYEQKHFQWFFMKKIINSKFNMIYLFTLFLIIQI